MTLDRDGPSALISVRDEGSGIHENLRNQVFEPFGGYNTDNSARNNIGLSVARSFVDRHKGTISFNTAEGLGTTFFVTLPLYSADVVSIVNREDSQLH